MAGLLAFIGEKRNLHVGFRNDEERRSRGRRGKIVLMWIIRE
jgi:hypothetical protein